MKDPNNIRGLLYDLCLEYAKDLKADDCTLPLKERITVLLGIRHVMASLGLLKESDDEHAGSAVRRFSKTFAANAAGTRKPHARPRARSRPPNNTGSNNGSTSGPDETEHQGDAG
jgi:hypothetical protein